ncbi:MAG: AAA family ATPase [Patescibacteria group bacterium]|nr:AAA family ATPase [Patescibacteria group bacterium]
MQISQDKKKIIQKLLSWYQKHYKQSAYITVGGYAGTGKTTLIAIFRRIIHKKNDELKVAFVSYTGKAAQVLKNKLKQNKTLYDNDFVGTIHSLIYSPVVNSKQQIVGWEKKDNLDYDLIIIDEASMVDYEIWNDLLSYSTSIIAVGDHGQLPPIKSNFNLMSNPNLKLETIHRQARNNPIIELSIQAREKGHIPIKKFSNKVMKINQKDVAAQELAENLIENYDENMMLLTGYNFSRKQLNQTVRQNLGFFEYEPQPHDRVICLRNNHSKGIYNGMLGTIISINQKDKDWYFAKIKMDDLEKNYTGLISVKQFKSKKTLNFTDKRSQIMKGDLFDFGYALTVHKAQGSQAKKVVLFEQRFKQMNDNEWKRWLYTAVTRAEEELYIFGTD